jgi:CheY-like chemotaxis protein
MARILIVDDDAFTRELLRIQLVKDGHSVKEAKDATEALRALLQSDFELVFTDINMPYMDGVELAKAIMGDPKTRHVPVIVLTGSADQAAFERAERLGTRLMTKPVQGDELLSEVRKALGRDSVRPGGA